MRYIFALLGTALLAILLESCKNEVGTIESGSLILTFDNVVGNQDLQLNSTTYQNAAGEEFTVTKFNYYVSNFRLIKADGSEYVLPQDNNYYLVQENLPESQTVTLANIPTGSYTGVSFIIGVDSLRSLADISQRTGVLDPGLSTHEAMYWDWNSGYIFLKLEGISPYAPVTQNNQFFYHIGGFGGGYNGKKTINNLRTVTLSFDNLSANVTTGASPKINLTADVLKLFNGTTTLRIAENSSVMFTDYSTNIADNYAQMIRYVSQTTQ